MANERETRACINALKSENANLEKENANLNSEIERLKGVLVEMREQNSRASRTIAAYQRAGFGSLEHLFLRQRDGERKRPESEF